MPVKDTSFCPEQEIFNKWQKKTERRDQERGQRDLPDVIDHVKPTFMSNSLGLPNVYMVSI
jgi:hypothetical protein